MRTSVHLEQHVETPQQVLSVLGCTLVSPMTGFESPRTTDDNVAMVQELECYKSDSLLHDPWTNDI